MSRVFNVDMGISLLKYTIKTKIFESHLYKNDKEVNMKIKINLEMKFRSQRNII